MFFFKARQSAAPEAQERRRSIRHATVMQVAKIRFGTGREELCVLRDVSPEGLKAEVYIAVAAGEHVEIELRTGHTVGGRVAWCEGTVIGLSFDEPMPMAAMMAHCSIDERVGAIRPPRLNVQLEGMLRLGVSDRVVAIGNISQAGLQIAAPESLDLGRPCMITLPQLAPRAATIRWWREGQAGLMLAEPLDYAAFAEWRAALAG